MQSIDSELGMFIVIVTLHSLLVGSHGPFTLGSPPTSRLLHFPMATPHLGLTETPTAKILIITGLSRSS